MFFVCGYYSDVLVLVLMDIFNVNLALLLAECVINDISGLKFCV